MHGNEVYKHSRSSDVLLNECNHFIYAWPMVEDKFFLHLFPSLQINQRTWPSTSFTLGDSESNVLYTVFDL
jgi:hypothetical protein